MGGGRGGRGIDVGVRRGRVGADQHVIDVEVHPLHERVVAHGRGGGGGLQHHGGALGDEGVVDRAQHGGARGKVARGQSRDRVSSVRDLDGEQVRARLNRGPGDGTGAATGWLRVGGGSQRGAVDEEAVGEPARGLRAGGLGGDGHLGSNGAVRLVLERLGKHLPEAAHDRDRVGAGRGDRDGRRVGGPVAGAAVGDDDGGDAAAGNRGGGGGAGAVPAGD